MKTFTWTLLSLFVIIKLQAQDVQVTLVDPCSTIDKKSTIIINDNATTATAQARPVAETNTVNFTLTSSVNTSAGVYNAAGSLVRTLWNGVRYDAGNYKALWNGVLDDGTQAPPGNYQFKLLTNNVQYTWEGVIGNTSTDLTGDYIHKGENLEDICFIGGNAFFANGYAEHSSAQKMFAVANPQKITNTRFEQTTQSSYHVCTDGNLIYWAGLSYYSSDSWVFGAYPADNTSPYATMAPFSAGVVEDNNDASGHYTYNNAISVVKGNGNAFISGICVQKTGNFLFVARAGLNQLQVLNKTTGALLQTLTYANVQDVACDDSNHLWAIFGNSVHKLTINSNGTLTDLNASFTGLNKPTCLGISSDYSTVSVGDNGTYQIKSYSTSAGGLTWTLGQAGGYSVNPYIVNDKFFYIHFVRYQPDGSFWVGDKENFRTLHFNADRTYKEFIGFLPTFRTAMADQNDPKRIFAGFVEYERDYTKSLDNGTNGSWKHKANWQYGITNVDNYSGFYNVVTLNNNRTYGKIFLKNDGTGSEVELTSTGLRYTGANGAKAVGRDGTLFYAENVNNDHINIHKKTLTGFDANGNPSRPNDVVFVSTPSGSNNEYSPGWAYEANTGHTGAADKYIWFNYSSPPQNSNPDGILGWHLGAVKTGDNTYIWKASKSTFTNYYGSYPTNGDFDIGNGWPQQHSTTRAMIYDKDIFFNANGEFWKGGEINIWNHFNDDGLLIGHFGVSGLKNNNGAAGMAGNALSNAMVKVSNDYYIYHCDESVHGGIHSWHVTGLNTIAEQTIPIVVSTGITIPPDLASLMSGLTFRSTFTGGNGWTVDQPTSGLSMSTGLLQYQKNFTDLNISGSATQVVKRSLNNNATLNNWTLSGGITMQDSEPTIGSDNYNYLEVLDVAGKIIARFQAYANPRDSYHTYLRLNSDINIADGFADFYNNGIRANFMDFSFNYSNNNLTFQLANYNSVTIGTTFDSGAKKSAPAYLRINQSSSGNQNHAMDLYKLKFTGN